MVKSEAWFMQRKRWQRPLVASWRGAIAGIVFIAMFFAINAVFLLFQPFEPLNI
jgi:hypothetical protein